MLVISYIAVCGLRLFIWWLALAAFAGVAFA